MTIIKIEAENCAINASLEIDYPDTPAGQISHATCLQKPVGVSPNTEALITPGGCHCRNYRCPLNSAGKYNLPIHQDSSLFS